MSSSRSLVTSTPRGLPIARMRRVFESAQVERRLTKLLASGNERAETAPETPTFREQGVDVISGSSRGLAVPAGTDPEIVAVLAEAVKQAVNDPEYLAKAKAAGVPVRYIGGTEYDAFLAEVSKSLDVAWEKTPWTK